MSAMTRADAIVWFFILLGFFATLAGFVVAVALVANDLTYRLERRRAVRHSRPEPAVACAVYPLEMHRSRRDEHPRSAA